jgi:thiosulfate reductase cytochrome b subunit
MKLFWLHFTSAYGTIWFVLLILALITQSNIRTGEFGLFGFPVLAAVYAWFVTNSVKEKEQNEIDRLSEENSVLKRIIAEHLRKSEES